MNDPYEIYSLLFPLITWFGIFFFIGQISGWKTLAQLYPGRDVSLHGKQTFRWQMGKIGKTRYKNALTIHTTIEGMQLEMPWIFRFNHPSIFIPWAMVTKLVPDKGWGIDYITIHTQQNEIPIQVKLNIFENNHTIPQSITDKLLQRTK